MQRLPNLINSLLQQGIIRSSWQQFAQETSKLFDADGCSFCFREIEKPNIPIILGADRSDLQKTSLLIGTDVDHPVCKLLRDTPVGEVIRHEQPISQVDDERLADLKQIVAVTAYRDEKYEAVLSLGRNKDKQEFGEPELELLNQFLPYFTMALEQHSQRLLPNQQVNVQELLEQFDDNLAVIDSKATLLAFNTRFDQLKVSKRILYLYASKIHFYDKAIHRWMLDAMQQGSQSELCALKRIEEQGHEVVIKIKQFNHKAALADSENKKYFMLSIGNSDEKIRFEQYRRLFKLTKAEAELAAFLSMGKTINQLASKKLLSKHTLRTQLKSVFAKTQTHSQNELIVLLKNVC